MCYYGLKALFYVIFKVTYNCLVDVTVFNYVLNTHYNNFVRRVKSLHVVAELYYLLYYGHD